ncbi:hypothetical protein RHMOL_Rhmol01G0124700 [Rhododendron molle]|uniref:Uncharacterized protein n=1 Tax=Rhododendron molle TaxID=49168 RepID=A0ACC0Q235_RHOML|nr:hypothetical protein RHMOL_Rhmol01G0124700 [Rhododendron molle]
MCTKSIPHSKRQIMLGLRIGVLIPMCNCCLLKFLNSRSIIHLCSYLCTQTWMTILRPNIACTLQCS